MQENTGSSMNTITRCAHDEQRHRGRHAPLPACCTGWRGAGLSPTAGQCARQKQSLHGSTHSLCVPPPLVLPLFLPAAPTTHLQRLSTVWCTCTLSDPQAARRRLHSAGHVATQARSAQTMPSCCNTAKHCHARAHKWGAPFCYAHL